MIASLRAPLFCAFVVSLTLLTLAACDSGGPEEPPIGITGRWTGGLISVDTTGGRQDTLRLPITVLLDDTGFNVTGAGSIHFPSDSVLTFVVVGGLFGDPKVSLSVQYPVPPPGGLSGRLTAGRDSIIGTLTGPGRVNARLNLGLRR